MNPTVKNVLAAVLGYVVMVLVVFATFSLLWGWLGPSGAFEPGTWEVSSPWLAGSIVLGFLAALLGGAACARVQADRRGVVILIGLVVVLGIISALPEAADVVGPRPDDVDMGEAMTSARQPGWVAWLNPLIGAAGVYLGGGRRGRATSTA